MAAFESHRSITRNIGNAANDALGQVQFEMFGDWAAARGIFKNLDYAIKIGSMKGQLAASKQLQKIVKRRLRNSEFSPGLSGSYASRKAADGYDSDKILYRTGTYYRSIHVWRKGNRSYVGVKSRTYAPGSKRTVGQIALMHEVGGGRLPARPLWAPSWKEFGGRRKLRSLMIWHIKREISKMR